MKAEPRRIIRPAGLAEFSVLLPVHIAMERQVKRTDIHGLVADFVADEDQRWFEDHPS